MVASILTKFSDYLGLTTYYGYFLFSQSLGLMIGSILAKRFEKYSIGKLTISLFFSSAVCWMTSSLSGNTLLTILFMGLAFIPLGINNIVTSSLLQKSVNKKMLGSVFSWVASLSTIFYPLGSLLGGFLGDVLHVKIVYSLGIPALLFCSIYWALSPTLLHLKKMEEVSKIPINSIDSFSNRKITDV
mgnify:CR=1 FL=1